MEGYAAGYEAMRGHLKDEMEAGTLNNKRLKELLHVEVEFKIEDEANTDTTSQRPDTARFNSTSIAEAEGSELETAVKAPALAASAVTPFIAQTPVFTAEDKAKAVLRNLNIILYVASFLLVAAAAACMGTADSPDSVKLVGLIVVTIAMYIGGIALYKNVPKLKPAAMAFTGTSLGIVPFIGVAMVTLAGISGQVAWLVTSVFGLSAYILAAVVLKSQTVAWLVMAFVLSLSCSACATASLPVVWYFVSLIAVSLVATLLNTLKPKLLPTYFKQPIEVTGQIVTPIALVASLLVYGRASSFMYEIVFGAATLQYLVVWLQQHGYKYELATRLLAHITLLILGCDVFELKTLATVSVWSIAVALLHAVFSLVRVKPKNVENRQAESVWLGCLLGLIGISTLATIGAEHAAAYVTYGLSALLALGAVTAFRYNTTVWAYTSLGVSYLLPFVIGRWLVEPSLPWWVVLSLPLIVSGCALAVLWSKKDVALFLQITTISHIVLAVLASPLSNSVDTISYILFFASALLVAFSYATKHIPYEVAGFIGAIMATVLLLGKLDVGDWIINISVFASVGVAAAGVIVHSLTHESKRRNALIALSLVAGFGLLYNLTVLNSRPDIDATVVTGFVLFSGVSLWLDQSLKNVSASMKNFLMGACLCHIACNIIIGVIAKNVLIGGYAFTASAAILLIVSYLLKQALVEGAGFVCMAVAAALLLTKANLGDWYVTVTMLVVAGVALVGVLIHHFLNEPLRRNVLLALGMIAFGGLAINAAQSVFCLSAACHPEVARVSFWSLTGAAVASFLGRTIARDKTLQSIFTVGYPIYLLLGWLLSLAIGDWTLSVAFYAIAAVAFLAASYIESQPPLTIVGNLATFMFMNQLIPNVFDGSFHWSVYLVCVVSGIIFYSLYVFALKFKDDWRKWSYLVSTWIVLGAAVWSGLGQSTAMQCLAAATLIFGAGTVALQGYLVKSRAALEGSAYIATAGCHWLILAVLPELNLVFYAHLWAVVVAGMAMVLYKTSEDSGQRVNRLVLAAALVSGSVGIVALSLGGWYQLLFLVEHLTLLVAGALTRKQWATWWGAIGAVLAVFYFIKDFVFLWLALLGIGLIVLVIWRLFKLGKSHNE
jgi:hypothetical protein